MGRSYLKRLEPCCSADESDPAALKMLEEFVRSFAPPDRSVWVPKESLYERYLAFCERQYTRHNRRTFPLMPQAFNRASAGGPSTATMSGPTTSSLSAPTMGGRYGC